MSTRVTESGSAAGLRRRTAGLLLLRKTLAFSICDLRGDADRQGAWRSPWNMPKGYAGTALITTTRRIGGCRSGRRRGWTRETSNAALRGVG